VSEESYEMRERVVRGGLLGKLLTPRGAQLTTGADLALRSSLAVMPQEGVPPVSVLFEIARGEYAIYLGRTVNLRYPVYWNPNYLLNQHICILGMSGSGKSFTIKNLVIRMRQKFFPNVLILDPVGEYSWVVDTLDGVELVLGKNAFINILEPPTESTSPFEWAMHLSDILTKVLELKQAPLQRRVLMEAITEAYIRHGVTEDPTTWRRPMPTLADVYGILREKEDAYVRGQRRDMRRSLVEAISGLSQKLRPFVSPPGNWFAERSKPRPLRDLARSGVVSINMSGLSQTAQNIINFVVVKYLELLMREWGIAHGEIRLVLVIDEAWKLLKDEESPVVPIAREARKFGFSMILATQNIGDVNPDVLCNIATIFLMNIQDAEAARRLLKSLGFNEEHYLPRLAGAGQGEILAKFTWKRPKWLGPVHFRFEGDIEEVWVTVKSPDVPGPEVVVKNIIAQAFRLRQPRS